MRWKRSVQKELEEQKKEIYDQIGSSDIYNYVDIIDKIFTLFGYREYDRDEAIAAMLKGYVSATGDKYAAYYTKEEYDARIDSTMAQAMYDPQREYIAKQKDVYDAAFFEEYA